MSENKKDKKRVWLLALVLAICVFITAMAVINNINHYQHDSNGAIDLVVDGNTDKGDTTDNTITSGDVTGDSKEDINSGTTTTASGTTYLYYTNPSHPGFEASDDEQVWTTETKVNIFKVAYENGVSNITVNSDKGDKLIAPGAENLYTFKFKNTGDVPVEYTLTAEVTIEGVDLSIPVEGRIRRHDGDYIVGDEITYANIIDLDGIEDTYTLATNRYTYYTLEWKWPFEGNDDFDTYLGDLATESDIILTIKLSTIATASDTNGGGIIIVDTSTGKDSTMGYASIGLIVLMFGFLFIDRDEKEYE